MRAFMGVMWPCLRRWFRTVLACGVSLRSLATLGHIVLLLFKVYEPLFGHDALSAMDEPVSIRPLRIRGRRALVDRLASVTEYNANIEFRMLLFEQHKLLTLAGAITPEPTFSLDDDVADAEVRQILSFASGDGVSHPGALIFEGNPCGCELAAHVSLKLVSVFSLRQRRLNHRFVASLIGASEGASYS